MKGFFAMLLFITSCLYHLAIDVRALAVPKENLVDEAAQKIGREIISDEDQIIELREQVLKLQQAVSKITISFSTLELVAKNPSLMKELLTWNTDTAMEESAKTRFRRDSHSSPLSSFNSSSSDQQPYLSTSIVGSNAWPMFSGQCFTCPAGVRGPIGPPGSQGVPGRDGRDGRDAPIKPQDRKVPGCEKTSSTVSRNSADIRPVGNTSQSGVIYIRWGNSLCPEEAELIYRGTLGGARYDHTGGGANYLCMPDVPIYNETNSSTQEERALLYSSEYESESSLVDRLNAIDDHTPTCAVCRAPSGYTTKIMIPARNVCPSREWRLEYAGYLMAGRYNHQKSEFVCVDREMEKEPGTEGNENGARLYVVEGRCMAGGGLPCGPYVNGNELTCAVCTI